MSPRVTVRDESQKNSEDGSNAWKEYAMKNSVVLERVIREITQQEDKLLNKLSKAANTISKTSLGSSLSEGQIADFEGLLCEASVIVIVFWQLYKKHKGEPKYDTLPWPHPKLKKSLNKLVDTVDHVHALIGRKCGKNLVKRVLVGCFGIRDLGKINKYQGRFDSLAFTLQKAPHNVKIHEVLMEVVNYPAQPQSQDTQFSEDRSEVDLPVKKDTETWTANKIPEGTALGKVEKSIAKSAIQKVRSRDADEDKQGVLETKDNVEDYCEGDDVEGDISVLRGASSQGANKSRCGEEREDKGKTIKSEEPEECTAGNRNNSQRHRKKMKSVPIVRPVPSHSSVSSGNMTFTNGSGMMINTGIGNACTREPDVHK